MYNKINYMNEEGFIEADRADGNTDLIDANFEVKATGIVSEINTKSGYIKVKDRV